MTKLFVGNLPYETTEDQLHEMVKAFGQVTSAKLIMDRDTGASRGFGFVEMPNDEEAKAAIEKLNGSSLGDRKIVVNVARPMEQRGGHRHGGGGGGHFNKHGRGGHRGWR